MRKDMAKVIVERPRWGGGRGGKGRKERNPDLLPRNEGMRRPYMQSGDWKTLSDNLSPLFRYLKKQAGRPWDKVWAEICENLRPTSTVQQHVRDHVFDYVAARGVHLSNGKVYVEQHFGGQETLEDSRYELWVDPRTGILRENRAGLNKRRKRKEAVRRHKREVHARMRIVDETRQYHLLDDGAWWEVNLVPISTKIRTTKRWNQTLYKEVEEPVTDAVLSAGLSNISLTELYGREDVIAISKRQLSKSEARRLGLR